MSQKKQEKNQNVAESPLDLTHFVLITHDMFFRETFADADLGKAYLQKTLKKQALEHIAMEKLEVFPTHFLTREFRELQADVIYQLELLDSKKKTPLFVILEHKSKNYRNTIYQVNQYVSALERLIFKAVAKSKKKKKTKKKKKKYRPPIILPIIVYNGEKPFRSPTRTEEQHEFLPGYEDFGQRIKMDVHDLARIPDDELPNDPNVPHMKPTLLILKYIFSKDFAAKFREALLLYQPHKHHPKYRYYNRLMWFYAISSATYITQEQLQEIANEIPNQIVEENEMPTLLERTKQKGIEIGIEKGIEKGKVEGKAEGKAEGKMEGKVESILLLLSLRLGFVPQQIEERLNTIEPKNISRLNDLFVLASKCRSLEEFEKAL